MKALFIICYFYHRKQRENVLSVNMFAFNTAFDNKNATQNVTFSVMRRPDYCLSVL